MTLSFVSVQTTFRNDGCGSRDLRFKTFSDKEDCLDHTIKRIFKLWEEGEGYRESVEVMRQHLQQGDGIWVPEWDRKGNGDEFFLSSRQNIWKGTVKRYKIL